MNQNFERLTLNDVLPVVAEYRDPSDDLHALNQKLLKKCVCETKESKKINPDLRLWATHILMVPTISLPSPSFKNMGRRMQKQTYGNGWNNSFNIGQVFYFKEVDLTIFE